MSDRLSDLERIIDKKCIEYRDGVIPQYHPHLPQMRQLSLMCIQFLANEPDLFTKDTVPISNGKGTAGRLKALLVFVATDIEEKGNITFYHYLGVLTSLSFHYVKMVNEKTYQQLSLEKEAQWDNLTWEACVWSLFYVAGTIFDDPLKAHNAIFDAHSTKLGDVIKYVENKILI